MGRKNICLAICFVIIAFYNVQSQDVPHHISNTNVYDLLDELANQHIIDLSTAVKPYSRKFIAEKLTEAQPQTDKLTKQQWKEVNFLLQDFNKDLLPAKSFKKRLDLYSYKDSLLNITVNPIGSFVYFANSEDKMYRQSVGGEFWATIGSHFSIYGSLRDQTDSRVVADSPYRNDIPGANYKFNGGVGSSSRGGSYDETRGGVMYAWKWGSFGILKDNFTWGNNYHGANIISDKAPSFPHIRLKLQPRKWLEFNYIHAWLSSEIIDSSRSYNSGVADRMVFHPKYFAANMFTFKPIKKLYLSIGNSIVYADELQLGMFTPVLFYKSVDHTLTGQGANYSGQNSQLFFDVSSRNLKNLHVYTSLFIDEIALGRALKEDQSNFLSLKIGAAYSHPALYGTTLIVEYTRTNPVTYRHFVNTTTYASNNFTLGHYLTDNAQEIFVGIKSRPIKKLYLEASITMIEVGPSYSYTGKDKSGLGLPFISNKEFESSVVNLKAKYEVINDAYLVGGITLSDNKGPMAKNYTPPFYFGKEGNTSTAYFGFNIGF
jgi:Capsule assembly protein Wzi